MIRNKIFKKVFAIFSLVAILITTFIPKVSGAEPIKPTENTGPDCIGYIGFKKVSNPQKYDVRYVPYGSTTSKSKYPVYFLYSKVDNKDIFCVDYGPVADSSNPLCKDATKSWLAQLDTTRENDLKTILSLSIHFARNGSYTHSSEINYAFTQMLVWDLCAQYGKAIGIPYKNTIGERISELYFEDTPTQQYYEKWRSQIVESVANYYAYPGSKLSQFESKYFVTDYKTASSKYLLKINTNVQLPSDTSPVEVVNSNPNTNFSQWSLFNSNSKVKYTYNTRLQLALYNQNNPLRGTEDLGLLVMNDRHPVKQFNNKWSGTHAYVGIYRSAKAQNQTVIKTEGVAYYLIPQTFKLTGQTKDIPQPSKVIIKKIDAKTKLPLKNVKFRICGIDNNFDNTYYTDNNGEIRMVLGKGRYKAIEIETPKGYKAISPVEFNVVNDRTEPITVTIENEKEPEPTNGIIRITKKDLKTGGVLEGVVFELLDSNKQVVRTARTNSQGIASFTKLEVGIYYVREKSTKIGYILKTNLEQAQITNTHKQENLTIYNEKELYNLSITKLDSKTGKAITGSDKVKNAEFRLKDPDGKDVYVTKISDGVYKQDRSSNYTLKLSSEGKIEIRDLSKKGRYTLTEVKSPIGYQLSTTPLVCDVANKTNNFAFKNTQIPKDGSVTIIKKDSKNQKTLEGVTFELLNKDKHVIKSSKTNSSGVVKFSNLEYGKYYTREKETIYGYKLNSQLHEVNINGVEKTITLPLFNEPIEKTIKIIKKDDKGNLLKDTEFTLFKKENSSLIKVGSKTTNSRGEVSFNNLRIGKYVLRETKAANNFRPYSKDIEIDLTRYLSPIYTVTLNNSKVEENIPSTGTKGSTVFLVSGISILGIAYFLKKRKIYA